MTTPEVPFAGKTAAITGGASGLGLSAAERLHEAGADIIVLDYNTETGEAAAMRLNEERAGSARFVQIDVSDHESVARAFAGLPPLAMLVNSAGIREIKGALEVDPAEFARVISINLNGTFYCSQQAAFNMRDNGGGVIINIASVAGMLAIKKRPAYVSSKHAVIGLTKLLAAELAEHNIRVNAIAPGTLRTAMTEAYYSDENFLAGLGDVVPLGHRGTAQDVSEAIAFLVSDAAQFITGVTLPVDGGWVIEKTFSPRPSVYNQS